jgi:hypothetical protein
MVPFICLGLSLVLGGVLWKGRLYPDFPWFVVYVNSSIVIQVARGLVIRDYRIYFKVFWATEAVYAAVLLLALHEVFHRVFFGFYNHKHFKWWFPSVVLLALIVTVWAAIHDPAIQASRLIRLVLFFGLAVNFMQICLVSLFVFLAQTHRLRWRFAPLGISLGFAVSALGAAAYYLIRSEFGTKFEIFAKYISPVAYIVALAIWLDTFLRPELEPEWLSKVTPRDLAGAIRRETESLKKVSEKLE